MAALDDDPGNALQPVGIAQQLIGFEPAVVAEEVVLDPGDRDCVIVGGEIGEHFGIGQQGHGHALPHRPDLGRGQPDGGIRAGQAMVIGFEQVVPLAWRDMPAELGPGLGVELARAVLVEPVILARGAEENPAQNQLADPLWVGLGVCQAEGRAPGAAEHQPFFMARHFAKPLDIGDQVPGGVVLKTGEGGGAPAAALIEQQHVV